MQINISFTPLEWMRIKDAMEAVPAKFNSKEWKMDVNIIDRIEKNLGVE